MVGPGTGTSDTAGLWALSNGEHILTAAEVNAAGGHGEVMRLRKALLSGAVQYAATGGPAERTYSPAVIYRPADRTAAAATPSGAVTFQAYGNDSEEALRRALREWEFQRL